MATVQHALCSALLILLGFAVFSSQSASSYTSTERGNATDPARLHFQEFCVKEGFVLRKVVFKWIFFSILQEMDPFACACTAS